MPRLVLVLACVGGFAAAAIGAVACSSSSNPGQAVHDAGSHDAGVGMDAEDEVCLPYESDADLTTPTVSFQTDVLPTLQFSCGIAGATCHGAPSVAISQQRPFLGYFDGGTDASQIVNGMVGVTSNEDPSMAVVKADDPANSYLVHKIDGDQCTLASQCAASQTQYTNCGLQMPYSSQPLDQPTRDTIRRWVAQGAKNN
jgi:hypothetical protein